MSQDIKPELAKFIKALEQFDQLLTNCSQTQPYFLFGSTALAIWLAQSKQKLNFNLEFEDLDFFTTKKTIHSLKKYLDQQQLTYTFVDEQHAFPDLDNPIKPINLQFNFAEVEFDIWSGVGDGVIASADNQSSLAQVNIRDAINFLNQKIKIFQPDAIANIYQHLIIPKELTKNQQHQQLKNNIEALVLDRKEKIKLAETLTKNFSFETNIFSQAKLALTI